jgi:OmpA-OmpF porin, OOP family
LRQVILEKNMNNMNMKRVAKAVAGTLGLVGLAVVNSPFAMAADSGWLVGGNIGQSRAEIDDARISAMLRDTGLASTISDDDTDIAFKIFGGYKFNRYFALEGGYFNLGRFGYTATTTPAGTLTGRIRLQGLNLDAVGILPFTEKFSGFGRLGVHYTEAKDNFVSTGAVATPGDPNPSERDVNLKAGLGLQYDFTEHVGMRAEWERYRVNDAVGNVGDINMVSLGVVVMLGRKPEPAPRAAAPPPPRVVAAPARAKERYCSVLALTYEINRDVIQRDDMEKLGVLVTFMKKYPETTAIIEGHTDNVGTAQKNMELSRRRAQSVVDYLVNEQKIAASRLTAVGHGEERPLADNNTREGQQMNRRINAVITCATDFEGLKVVTAKTAVAMDLEFDPYRHDVKPEYRDELRKVANFMKANPSVTAVVEGHADNIAGLGAQQTRPTATVSMVWRDPAYRLRHDPRGSAGKPQGCDHLQLCEITAASDFGNIAEVLFSTFKEHDHDNDHQSGYHHHSCRNAGRCARLRTDRHARGNRGVCR